MYQLLYLALSLYDLFVCWNLKQKKLIGTFGTFMQFSEFAVKKISWKPWQTYSGPNKNFRIILLRCVFSDDGNKQTNEFNLMMAKKAAWHHFRHCNLYNFSNLISKHFCLPYTVYIIHKNFSSEIKMNSSLLEMNRCKWLCLTTNKLHSKKPLRLYVYCAGAYRIHINWCARIILYVSVW